MPGAGDLRERVTIEVERRTPNGQGGFTTAWSPTANVWAEIIGLNGGEGIRAGVERTTAIYRVNLRMRHDVTTKHRLHWNDQYLGIKSAIPHPQEPRAFLQLLCEAVG
jgi:SPP1 family predicted phage head-tail adaptor